MPAKTKAPMKDIYDRLSKLVVTRAFVKKYVLPDWWSDALAEVPANRAQAEMILSRQAIADRLRGRVLCLEEIIKGLMERMDFAELKKAIVPAMECDATERRKAEGERRKKDFALRPCFPPFAGNGAHPVRRDELLTPP